MMKIGTILAGVLCAMMASAAMGQTTVLYNGAAGSGNQTPQSQGWLEYTAVGGTPTVSSSSGGTSFDTTSNASIFAGYSNYNVLPSIALVNSSFPTLNPTTGFSVDFTMQLNSESHSVNNRAGFSVIALGSDDKGIELAFWTPQGPSTNNIWVQSGSDFNQAEGAVFDDSSALNNYQLSILGSTYTLYANGNSVLTGSTRNYSTGTPPYDLSNYVFFGDDTTAADASEEITSLSVAVPEPMMGGLMIGLAAMVMMARPRRVRIE